MAGRWARRLGCLAWLAAGVAEAREPQAPRRDASPVEWYEVKPGDNLERLAERHLGDSSLWRELWRLNPEIKDPHLLEPGTRIRLVADRAFSAVTARIDKVRLRVEKKPEPADWQAAKVGDELKERDGVRTFTGASAELLFQDGARFELTEDSLVVLHEVASTATGVGRETIEVVNGQADLSYERVPGASSQVELILGEARAHPEPDAAGRGTSRLKRSQAGAQLMVYSGRAKLAAAGAEVQVPQGMGTAVDEGAAPIRPERLLAPPQATEPEAGQKFDWANPLLRWAPLAGARSYIVEVCADPDCRDKRYWGRGIEVTSWRPAWLPVGTWYWRVTGTSDKLLDGYPSATRQLLIAGAYPDRDPPVVLVLRRAMEWESRRTPGRRVVSGAAELAVNSPHWEEGVTLRVRQGAPLVLNGLDDLSGIRTISYRFDGGVWTDEAGAARVTLPMGQTGLLEVRATDRAGRESAPWSARVTSWTGPEDLPDVRIERGGK